MTYSVNKEIEEAMKKNAKSEKVVDCALMLLTEQGDHGLTMRQVAQRADMSLSNVQYYFKNKDALLTAVADRYFNQCLIEVQRQPLQLSQANLRPELTKMLKEYLAHGLEISEMCRIFREYWAIATRNAAIAEYLTNYYRQLGDAVAQKLQPVANSPEAVSNAVSVIIPFVEGYTITAPSLAKSFEETTEQLTNIVIQQLTGVDSP